MSNAYSYLKQHPVTIIVLAIYYIIWFPLLIILVTNKVLFEPIVVGEFPLAPVVTIPFTIIFTIIMVINAIFRKEHKLFYVIIAGLIYLPLFLLGLKA